jgi:hypothetical protein
VISGAAFCPHPPLLAPAVAGGAATESAALRAACRAAITRIAALSDRLVLVGAGERTVSHAPAAVGTFAGFGVDLRARLDPAVEGPLELPLALTVGADLVEDAIGDALPRGAMSIGSGADGPAEGARLLGELTAHGRVGLVVMGDGTACRSTGAPGYVDERAVPFDDAIAAALRDGDAYALEDLDQTVADDLLVAGASAWRAVGRVLRNARFDAELLSYDAPFGVAYFVATWIPRG